MISKLTAAHLRLRSLHYCGSTVIATDLYPGGYDGVICILTGFHDRACKDCCMSGRHHHRQVLNSLGKGNPSWAILGSVCTSQNPEQAKHRSDLLSGT